MAANIGFIKSKKRDGDQLVVDLFGSLTVDTADEFYDSLKDELDGVMTLILDMKLMAYVTSAGIRSLVRIVKQMSAQGGKVIARNVNEDVMNVFELLNIKSIVEIQ